jgi:hypothetical protein
MKMKTKLSIESLEHYMFTKNHIMNLCFNLDEKKKKINNNFDSNIQKQKKDNSFFIPSEKDTLFWCYFIIINGIQNYETLFGNTFKEEKEQKINFIETLRKHKDILKKYKFKKTELETDIVYSDKITIKTFLAMCAIQNINVALLKNRCLYTLISNDASSDIHILKNDGDRFGCFILDKKDLQKKFNELSCSYWLVTNISKPLAGQSSYKLPQLKEIAEKLKIPTVNGDGKKLKKADLYNLIKQKI